MFADKKTLEAGIKITQIKKMVWVIFTSIYILFIVAISMLDIIGAYKVHCCEFNNEKVINKVRDNYSDNCISYFYYSVFDEKAERGIIKWTKEEVVISFLSNVKESDSVFLLNAVNKINTIIGNDLFVIKDFNLFKTDIAINIDYNYSSKDSNNKGDGYAYLFYNNKNELTSSIIDIKICKNNNDAYYSNWIVLHELLHAIGFQGHARSIFKGALTTSSDYDQLDIDFITGNDVEYEALKLLYSGYLPYYTTKKDFMDNVINVEKRGELILDYKLK